MRRRNVAFGRLQLRHRRLCAGGAGGAAWEEERTPPTVALPGRPFGRAFDVLGKAPVRGASRLFWRGERPKTKSRIEQDTIRGIAARTITSHDASTGSKNRVFGQPVGVVPFARRVLRAAAHCPLAPRSASGLAVLLECPAFVHACLFSFVRKKEAACGMFRSCSARSESPLERSQSPVRLSNFAGSLRAVRFFMAIPTGLRGTREYGVGGGGMGKRTPPTIALRAAYCVRPCGSVGMSCVRPRLSFFLCQEKRSGLRYVSFLFREVGIAVRAFSKPRAVIELCRFTSGCAFLYGDSDGVTGDAEIRGTESAARREDAFAQSHLPCNDTAGSPLGLRAPNLRQRVFDSLDSPHAAAECVGRKSRLSTLLRNRIGFAVSSAESPLGLNVEAALRPLWTLLTLRRVMLAKIRGVVALYAGTAPIPHS